MKLSVFESISVDGYFTDRQRDIAWAHSGREDPEFGAWVGANANQGGILLFGRVTYQMMEAFWPSPAAAAQMPEVALRAEDGRGITVLGSGSVVAQLGEAGLVDEYQFVVLPVALGGGRTVFTKKGTLRLMEQRAFRCGNVVLTYATSHG